MEALKLKKDDDSYELWFHDHATKYTNTQIVFHLNQMGFFQLLRDKGALPFDQLAKELGAETRLFRGIVTFLAQTDEIIDLDGEVVSLTEFGKGVLNRYSRKGGDSFNLFDVRVGGYGSIWSKLKELATGKLKYGKDVRRDGSFSESALSILSERLYGNLSKIIKENEGSIDGIVELGVGSSLLALSSRDFSQFKFAGVDIHQETIDKAQKRQADIKTDVQFFRGDLFASKGLFGKMGMKRPLIYSCHFHEFLLAGEKKVQELTEELRQQFPGGLLIAYEEPLVESRNCSLAHWYYSHTNVLIHDVCEKGHVLRESEWIELFEKAGSKFIGVEPTGFLQYRSYLFQL